MTRSEAIDYVYTRIPVTEYPVLTPEAVRAIVDAGTRHSVHAVDTAYTVQATVVPSSANGRQYLCVVPGTTGSTAPAWPSYLYARNGQLITDGTVTWQDDGPAYPDRFDMGTILREVWLAKASIAAADVDVSDGAVRIAASQASERCLRMASRHLRAGVV